GLDQPPQLVGVVNTGLTGEVLPDDLPADPPCALNPTKRTVLSGTAHTGCPGGLKQSGGRRAGSVGGLKRIANVVVARTAQIVLWNRPVRRVPLSPQAVHERVSQRVQPVERGTAE